MAHANLVLQHWKSFKTLVAATEDDTESVLIDGRSLDLAHIVYVAR